jgi:hypothetical protein
VGANVQFNLGADVLSPFVRIGGGILRFDPDTGARRERVAVNAGAGLRLGLGSMQAELFAERLAFRLDPSQLFATGGGDPQSVAEEQRATVYGIAAAIPLSSSRGRAADGELSSTTAPLEPFVGRLRYASDVDLPDVELVGLRAGLDFSPLFGVRGFWWRGVNEDRDRMIPVSGYGGEAQFNLGSATGVTPFLVAGAGRLHYGESFLDPDGERRDDQSALVLGGGASLVLSDRVRVNVAARDYIVSPDRALTETGDPDNLLHNTLLSAGFTLNFGPAGREQRQPVPPRTDTTPAELERLRAENARLRAERARVDTVVTRMPADTIGTRPRVDTVTVGDTVGTGATGRMITIPIPERGEIILRYGVTSDSARSADDLARMDAIRRVIREQLGADTTLLRTTGERLDSTAMEVRLRLLEERLMARMAELVEARTREVSPPQPPVVVVAPTGEADAGEGRRGTFLSRLAGVRANDIRPRVGLQTGNDVQLILSARADLGPVAPSSDLQLVPELALGFGEGATTVLALSSVRYSPVTIGSRFAVQPYVMGGVGFYSRTILAVNTAIGATLDLRAGRTSPLYAFIELQGINVFADTRLMLGVSTRR